MIEREHELPLTRQAAVLKLSRSGLYLSRSGLYYCPRPVAPADLTVMRRIDELHLDYPFAGSRMLRDLLRGEGIAIGRQRVATMMKRMDIAATYRRPNTSKPAPGHENYLLRSLAVERPNQVWAMDITYIPMARGFVYLAAVVDWFSRRVLAWRLSITMEVGFCLEAVEEALAKHGRPEIFNTDQGSQFTSSEFTGLLLKHAIAISMDGKDRGGTTSSSSGYGARSNTRRSISGPMTASPRRARRSAVSGHLQSQASAFEPRRADARSRLLRPPAAGRGSMNFTAVSGITLVGLRPPGVPPRNPHTTSATGRASTYQERNAVQTKPATPRTSRDETG